MFLEHNGCILPFPVTHDYLLRGHRVCRGAAGRKQLLLPLEVHCMPSITEWKRRDTLGCLKLKFNGIEIWSRNSGCHLIGKGLSLSRGTMSYSRATRIWHCSAGGQGHHNATCTAAGIWGSTNLVGFACRLEAPRQWRPHLFVHECLASVRPAHVLLWHM